MTDSYGGMSAEEFAAMLHRNTSALLGDGVSSNEALARWTPEASLAALAEGVEELRRKGGPR